jgi:hypothetical protein
MLKTKYLIKCTTKYFEIVNMELSRLLVAMLSPHFVIFYLFSEGLSSGKQIAYLAMQGNVLEGKYFTDDPIHVLVGNPKPISFLASWSQSYDF